VGIYSIQPIFQSADRFTKDGIAKVRLNGKFGYIDINGNFVIDAQFKEIESFRTDAPLRVTIYPGPDVRYGFVSQKGDWAFPATYEWAYVFQNGFAHVAKYGDGPYGQRPSKHGFIDPQGNLVIPLKFDGAKSFGANGLAAVKVENKWGFINTKGTLVIDPQFDGVPDSSESVFDAHGLARVTKGQSLILINSDGSQVGPNGCDAIGPFDENGLAVVGSTAFLGRRKAGVINTKGEYVFEPQFDNFLAFKNGLAQVSIDGKWGYIDTHGKIVVPPRYPLYGTDFDTNGTAQVVLGITKKLDGSPKDVELVYGYINTSGELIIRPGQYEEVIPFNEGGLAVVRKDGKRGFVNAAGIEVVGWFDDAKSFSQVGLAPARKDGKWGYIDKGGNFVISPQFDDAFNFSPDGNAIVMLGGKKGIVSTKGHYVAMPIFDRVSWFSDDGLANAILDGKSGYIDLKGDFFLKPQALSENSK